MMSYTGGAMSWNVTKCSKQKLSTKSLTETEVTNVSDYLTSFGPFLGLRILSPKECFVSRQPKYNENRLEWQTIL